MLTYMSDAVEPYLRELEMNAPDYGVRSGAKIALRVREMEKRTDVTSWRHWNLQSAMYES
jgi:hypothetical protein